MSYKPEQFAPYMDLDESRFRLVQDEERLSDKKLETKPVGYFRDALNRFCKNKGSVVCGLILLVLVIYAILAPELSIYTATAKYGYYSYALPRNQLCVDLGLDFWDGCQLLSVNQQTYDYYSAIPGAIVNADEVEPYEKVAAAGRTSTYYDIRVDSYAKVGYQTVLLTASEYEAARAYEEETGIQLLYPLVDETLINCATYKQDACNAWYLTDAKGVAQRDENGELQNIFLTDENSEDGYAYYTMQMSGNQYRVRVLYSAWFYYQYGFDASFLFGADSYGYDICARLGFGARLSFGLAILVSSISLLIGIVVGALEGYYGGAFDLIMERIKDILWEIPTVVFMSLFQIYLAKKLGPIVTLFFCFIFFNWIGTSSTVRAQFYRFKGQEYVLAARTLGAKDNRLIFRHILPNALGFIITASVLSIPGVIFTEANMTYLGIVNLQSSTSTSIGTMLSNAQATLSTYPHCVFFPAVFISILLICFNIFGNGLRDAFNPSLRGADE